MPLARQTQQVYQYKPTAKKKIFALVENHCKIVLFLELRLFSK